MNLSPEQIASIVRRHLPRGWRHIVRKRVTMGGKIFRGVCHIHGRKIVTEPIADRGTLYVFLHEVGHVRCGHMDDFIFKHIEEYEAERYAIAVMRAEEIPVPQDELYWAKANVRDCIREDEARGRRIQPHIKRWSRK